MPEHRDAGYRVVQWATGNIGTRALRTTIEHPSLSLVGVYVYSDDKAGRDAGELCGTGPTGVPATREIADILALGADCILYMPRACDLDEVCALLASGANIVTTRGEFHHPASLDPDVRARVEAACVTGGTSIHSTGSSPGFISEALPLVLTSIQRRLDHLSIDEFADLGSRDSPGLLFDVMGFGRPPGRSTRAASSTAGSASGRRSDWSPTRSGCRSTRSSRAVPSRPHAAPWRSRRGRSRPAPSPRSASPSPASANGRPLLRFTANWYCTTELEPAWDLRPTGWRVVVDGDAPLDVQIGFPVAARPVGRHVAGPDRAPRRQRRPGGVRGAARHPHDRRPSAGDRHARPRRSPGGRGVNAPRVPGAEGDRAGVPGAEGDRAEGPGGRVPGAEGDRGGRDPRRGERFSPALTPASGAIFAPPGRDVAWLGLRARQTRQLARISRHLGDAGRWWTAENSDRER